MRFAPPWPMSAATISGSSPGERAARRRPPASSTEIYIKVDIESAREVAIGDGGPCYEHREAVVVAQPAGRGDLAIRSLQARAGPQASC